MPWWIWAVAAAVLVAIVAGTWFFGGAMINGAEPAPTRSTAAAPQPQDPLAGLVPRVEDLTAVQQGGEVSFSWTNPDPVKGDSYLWEKVTLTGKEAPQNIEGTTVTLPADPSGTTCIEVTLRRSDGRSGDAVRGCTP
jgi:hypothetical protein